MFYEIRDEFGHLFVPGAALVIVLGLFRYFGAPSSPSDHVAVVEPSLAVTRAAPPFVTTNKPMSSPADRAQPAPAVDAAAIQPHTAESTTAPTVPVEPESRTGTQERPRITDLSAVHLPTIYFAPNSTDISESDRAKLQQAATLMEQLPPGTLVLIEGFTDRTGNRTANSKLAQRRADAVREVLVNAGLDPLMLRTKGLGVHPPAVGESRSREGRSSTAPHGRDRDVELHIAR